ncbi:PREDICTED: YDG domain-containing protein At5g47160-like [Camelina sativa]|uniref:YDG domain-containing protein At5g47160-like n=1 Tax=Camelina sativa TaxID=90675 RepID=A0ABM1RFA7_CAMSA|nr:PREDICTED: YDG domain-containing protein At5g47160-like [Camelina sativa]
MIQRTSPALKRRKVAAVRDFPPFTAKDEFGGAHVAVIRETKEEDLDGYGDDTKCVAHHRTSPSYKREKVSAVRDFPRFTVKNETSEIGSDDDVAVESETKEDLKNGYEDGKCAGSVALQDYHRPKEVESLDSIMKKAGFNGNVGNGKFPPAKRKVPLLSQNKVKPLSEEEGIRLMASHVKLSKRLQIPRHSPVNKTLSNATASRLRANAVQKHRHSPLAKKKLSNAAVLRPMTNAHKPIQHRDERQSNHHGVISIIRQNRITKDLSPREKVLKVLRIFKLVHDEFDRDKVPRRGESKTEANLRTRKVLMERGMQLNEKKMIGPVPGIEVGDEYQFKAELNIIGLHFNMRGGIDYMDDGNMKVATSIVSSEGSGYTDSCGSDVMFYCGEGGHKGVKVIKDQKLVAGNLALANSMERKTSVRVILGKERADHRGKDYVYDGLYMVDKYWTEKGPHGNIMYKFKLSRIAGQPSCDFFKRLV